MMFVMVEQVCFVEMDMVVDEVGQGEVFVDFDFDGFVGEFWFDCSDMVVFYVDVDGDGGLL